MPPWLMKPPFVVKSGKKTPNPIYLVEAPLHFFSKKLLGGCTQVAAPHSGAARAGRFAFWQPDWGAWRRSAEESERVSFRWEIDWEIVGQLKPRCFSWDFNIGTCASWIMHIKFERAKPCRLCSLSSVKLPDSNQRELGPVPSEDVAGWFFDHDMSKLLPIYNKWTSCC